MYHFILIDQEFTDSSFPETFKIFAQKQDGSWRIYGVEVPKDSLEHSITDIQKNMKAGTWYAHGYSENELIVIFKEKIFRVKPEPSESSEIVEYGKSLNIPEAQLAIIPHKKEQEEKYFNLA